MTPLGRRGRRGPRSPTPAHVRPAARSIPRTLPGVPVVLACALTAAIALLGAVPPVAATSAATAASPAGAASAGSTTPANLTTSADQTISPATDRALITLTSLSPSVVTPGDEVTLTGTVTAPTTGPLSSPRLRVLQGDAELTARSDIDSWARGQTAARGRELTSVALPTVAAGQTAPFRATVGPRAVRSDEPFAALPISIEVVQQSATIPIGVTRSFLAWHVRKEYEKLELATLIPVTLDPDLALFSRVAATRDAAWQSAIGATSRLRRIVDGTRGAAVTLAVDPSVFGPEARQTGPPPSQPPSASRSASPSASPSAPPSAPPAEAPSGTGSATGPATPPPTPSATTSGAQPSGIPSTTPTVPPTAGSSFGTGSPTISRLSDDLAGALRDRSVWALPYADADLAATLDLDPGNPLVRDLVDRSSLVSEALGHPVRSDIVWPVDGLMPAGRETGLATLMSGTDIGTAAGVVANSQAVTRDSPYTPTARRVATSGIPLLAYDPRLSALLPKRGDPSAALPVQRFLAETLVLLGERAGTPRSVLVAAPRTYDPDPTALAAFLAATAAAPWLTTVDAAALLSDAGPDRAVAQQQPGAVVRSAAPPPTLTTRRLTQMAAQRDTLHRVATVLRDGAQFERTYRELLDELASARWRFQPGSWPTLNNTVVSDTRAATSAIKVVARSVNFLAENGTLQITIDNGLPYSVADIRLVLAPTNPRMQIVDQPAPITIAPGSRTVVRVPVTAVAAGRADIRAFLTTADGTPIGSPAVIPVSANPIDGTIYWVGGLLVALVLLFGVVRALRKGTSRIDEIGDVEALAARRDAAAIKEGR